MIRVEGRALIIPDEERVIGYVDDNKIETREFYVTEAQLFESSFKLDVESADGRDIIDLAKKQADGGIVLLWEVLRETLQKAGTLHVQLRAFSESGEVWHSEVADFTVRRSIYDTKDFAKMQPTEFEEIERRATFAKEAAELSASEAEKSANDAKHEAENAEKARELAFQYANNALKSETGAEERARDAKVSCEAAKQSELAADVRAESAWNAESRATEAAGIAKLSETAAKTAAENAQAAADRAEKAAESELERIASVTVAPDADGTLPQSVVISQDADGLPFILSAFKLVCNVGSSGENKSISVLTNENDYMFSNVNIALKDTKKQWFVHYLNLGQFGGIAYAPATAEAKYPNANINGLRLQAYPEKTTHNKITLRVPTGYMFTEGTTFELWGVRV